MLMKKHLPVRREISAGGIVFFPHKDEREYLLLKHIRNGHWAFPKGHVEKGEGIKDAAKRELVEETGQPQFIILSVPPTPIHYSFRRGKTFVKKTVYYFTVLFKSKFVCLSHEHEDKAWLSLEEALELLEHNTDKRLLEVTDKKVSTLRL